jgi:hypothetical protein
MSEGGIIKLLVNEILVFVIAGTIQPFLLMLHQVYIEGREETKYKTEKN